MSAEKHGRVALRENLRQVQPDADAMELLKSVLLPWMETTMSAWSGPLPTCTCIIVGILTGVHPVQPPQALR